MYLYGASGHSKVIIDILKEHHIVVTAVLDDAPKGDFIYDVPVVQASQKLFDTSDVLIVSIGNNAIRKNIAQRLPVQFYTAIHPSAVVSSKATIGVGTVVMPNAVINAFSKIGDHCIVNSGAVVEHDCVLENYAHVSPGAALAGAVQVGEGSQIGIGACVIQGVTIGKWATIGAGAVIIDNVPDYAVVVGNPGKIIKYNEPS
ncbi:acetyltransferase with multiple hexapeptide repeat domain protein [Flavobacterium saliperosum S13]|uniref:Sugar O-acyltransferase, sialic acid O-acetyltransferase NeuD family n=2 Tax=Flavobacterium saliperosum TaxID=329186 RepID=A0A1G4VP19_9FLAO|nr:acetyltransferase [Flavobacterium saliperosum]ESU23539.1 acetyltransferase with multiple hexapeptide repeat domain protein [Flavobacterium saliperosum S13]SCX09698.1 sugar O-acyltransferase, sialic acid O-acetyltransferase NeuD family [Flavobacterium saliperosum]